MNHPYDKGSGNVCVLTARKEPDSALSAIRRNCRPFSLGCIQGGIGSVDVVCSRSTMTVSKAALIATLGTGLGVALSVILNAQNILAALRTPQFAKSLMTYDIAFGLVNSFLGAMLAGFFLVLYRDLRGLSNPVGLQDAALLWAAVTRASLAGTIVAVRRFPFHTLIEFMTVSPPSLPQVPWLIFFLLFYKESAPLLKHATRLIAIVLAVCVTLSGVWQTYQWYWSLNHNLFHANLFHGVNWDWKDNLAGTFGYSVCLPARNMLRGLSLV